ncbi:MAG: Deoxyguanosinetriphosphate triphosphohydrolase [Firmicutes bacterium ADurb.Bin193]|nr:MAG: Deoxyguanosinetriphosphate triphosphohydrolase [Firmicutes bacterium ADurb.Bin193]
MLLREITEKREEQYLSKYAALSKNTRGRDNPQPLCDIRTEFQRDRDRITHSKAFRRLKHKTQVFITPEGDHYRTRLTHTLEVAQIGRTIARALNLNEDLVEAMALGHDLGHTPFGHSGEEVLDEICPYGFKHYEQSVRIVKILENGTGLNLTYEVVDGIANHTGDNLASTLEGAVLKYADRIAYINHDIDDAIRGNILKADELPRNCIEILGKEHSERINTMILSIISESMDKPVVSMEPGVFKAMMELRSFLTDNVYIGSKAKAEEDKAKGIIRRLYEYFKSHPDELPPGVDTDDIDRRVCDYIAGMSDRYAVYRYSELFVPRSWQVL